ncbi:cellulose-binding protein [Lentzea sp. NBRC 105346]|uniref:lytic polysaccharide monooxygenase n=1 Tax=Lentzea sp. NBRC 105346 TaxID=3032205 RepID=UPI0024A32009|nr:lytic polysaccharide monooxygenase [Lentzea sp. NBRC 105346]GLZ30031.1 cellulose-binding protein [Lentzea sp. NBRC 105346]
MPWKRKLAVIAGLAPLLVFTLPAVTASAHGYVSSPASRQAQCAQKTVSCTGGAQWEPQSAEGPKGQFYCSGGRDDFKELNDDNKGWKVYDVGTSVQFRWTFTAYHRTRDYEYYIGGTRVAFVDGGNAAPVDPVVHTVNLSGFSGRQKIMARWNIGDTVNAFYSCIDVNIGGGGNPTPPTTTTTKPPTTTTTTTPPPAGGTWAPNTYYATGATVTYNGSTYRCRQAHTSLTGWEPPNAPALWEKI